MGTKITHHCDICQKELPNKYSIIDIKAGDSRKWSRNGNWRYKDSYIVMVCDSCIGDKITRADGLTGYYNIKGLGLKLLKSLNIIK